MRRPEQNWTAMQILDSHANMAVIGKHAYILAETGKMVEVNPFTPTYKPIKAPIVGAA